MIRQFLLAILSLWAVVFAADAKPIVPNPLGGTQVIQPGQTLFVPLTSGAYSAIPTATTAITNQVYWATDTQTLYRCTGTAWVALSGGSPTGAAGGDNSGTYPNPTVSGIKGAAVPSLVSGAFLKLNSGGAWEFVSYGTGADQPVAGNDSRLSDSRAPTGAAGGVLTGTYPNPAALAAGVVTDANVATANKDGTSGTPSLRTLGTGSQQAVAGNDSRLTNARAPSGAAGGDVTGTFPSSLVVSAVNGTALGTTANTAGTALIGTGTTISSVAITGDATIGAGGTLALKSTGTAGTYSKVTTDAQGRVTSGSSPSTLATAGITDGVQNAGTTPSIASGLLSARPSASVAGRLFVATDTGSLYRDSGASWALLLPALSGDVSTSGTTATLGTTGVSAGTYGDATHSAQVVIDAKGRATSASNVAITPSAGGLVGIVPLNSGGTAADLSATGGSGKVLKQTSSGGAVTVANLVNADLPSTGVTPGTYAGVTVNAQGVATSATALTTLSGYAIADAVRNAGTAPSIQTGADASKPAAGTSGRLYFAGDTLKLYLDNGSTWNLMLPALTGDATTSGTALTLAASGVSAGTYGDASHVAAVTIDAKGRTTSATSTAIALNASALTAGTLPVPRGGTGVTGWTDGQIGIGRTSDGTLVPALLTAGPGVTITGGPASETIGLAATAIQAANSVWAGPIGGGPAAPVFRALVPADIPLLNASQTFAGIFPPARGATGIDGSAAPNGSLLIGNGTGYSLNLLTAGSGIAITNTPGGISIASTASGSGTVTSVAMTVPSIFSLTGSPITTAGTFGLTLGSQTANTFFAGPNGSTGVPAFRAIVPADVPVMVASGSSHAPGLAPDPGASSGTTHYLREDGTWAVPPGGGGSGTVTSVAATVPSFLSVSGSPITAAGTLAISLSGTALPVPNGGSGVTSATANALLAGNGTSGFQSLATGTSGQFLQSAGSGSIPTWVPAPNASLTASYMGFGNGSNVLTGNSSMTYDGVGQMIVNNGPKFEITVYPNNNNFQFVQNGATLPGFSVGSGVPGVSDTGDFTLCCFSGGWNQAMRVFNNGHLTLNTNTDDGVHFLQVAGAASFAASTTSVASIRMPHGSAPSSPVNGDFWSTSSGFYGQVNGSTIGPFGPNAGYAGNSNTVLLIQKTAGVTSGNQTGIISNMVHAGGGGGGTFVDAFDGSTSSGPDAVAEQRGVWIGSAVNGAGTTTRAINFRASPTAIGTSGNAAFYIDLSGDSSVTTFTGNWGFYNGAGSSNFLGTGTTTSAGNVVLSVAGAQLQIKEGSNASMGLATEVAGTVTVSDTLVTANSRIMLTVQDPNGGTVGTEYISARTAGTSFTITSTSGSDTSKIAWQIIEPAP